MSKLPFKPTFTSLSDQIAIHGRFRAHEIALIEGNLRIDWATYNASGNRIGHALQKAGITQGMRVGMLVNNCAWAHDVLLGIWRAGAVAVPLSPMLTAEAVGRMLQDSDVSILFVSESHTQLATDASYSGLKVVAEGAEFERWTENFPVEPTGVLLDHDDLAVIIYSSGTTGTPKGIAHTHGSRLAFAAFFAAEFRFHYRSVALSCIPMHSNGAWLSWSPAKWFGATTVIVPSFTPDAFIESVKLYKPTHGFIVPAMATALLAHPDIESAGLSNFESAITAGSPMMDATKDEIRRLTNDALYELWGLTEGVATIIDPIDMAQYPRSVGRPMLGCDIRLIDKQGHDVTFDGVGEIVGYSSGALSGYWNRDDANNDLHWESQDGRMYIRTGDIGEFNDEGFLTLRGRLKDMIVSGGLNVYPVDIETVIASHSSVRDTAVVGIEDEKWGETPIAFVILTEKSHDDKESIKSWANARLAKHQRVHDVVNYETDFPRNTLGKVLKQELIAEYRLLQDRDKQSL